MFFILKFYRTYLQIAVEKGNKEIVNLLLSTNQIEINKITILKQHLINKIPLIPSFNSV